VSALPLALARRAVRRFLGPPPASTADVDAVLDVVRGTTRAVELTGWVRVERAGNRVALVRASHPQEPVDLVFPGRVASRRLTIEAWVETAPPTSWPEGRYTCVVDADAVGPAAVLRPARAGERFRPLGRAGTKTVFAALAECGIPASERASRLVLAAGGPRGALPLDAPWWVLGYRIDGRVRVTSRTRRFLWLAVTEPTG